MSLNEKKRIQQLHDSYLADGISRSKSFAGLSHRRTSSADSTFSSSYFDVDVSSSATNNGVLGQTSSYAKNFIHAFSSSKSAKLKAPRPQRTQIVFDALSKGLRDSILLAKNDISTSRVAFDTISVSSILSQGRLYELEKQMKSNERRLKRLEFHLLKIEEVKEQYDVQQRMRDGIRTMAYAYILSSGKEKENALQNVKIQFKQCTELMCTLECQLESLMGTLFFEMKGIQGFARICSGDIFEVVIKHGNQKWKSRGRVVKNGDQLWENKFVYFKALFSDPLCIKAVEVRGLGKNILLGNKFCEIRDLFCAHPQQMTINLNPSGSLKLNLVITWYPLNCPAEAFPPSTWFSSTGLPYSCGLNSVSQSSIQEAESFSEIALSPKESFMHDVNFCDKTDQSFSSESVSASAHSSTIASPDIEDLTRATLSTNTKNNVVPETNPVPVPSHLKPRDSNCNDSQTWSSLLEELSLFYSFSQPYSISDIFRGSHNLTDVLNSFAQLCLYDKQHGRTYPAIDEILSIVEEIKHCLKDKNSSKSGSNISISVESALGCFDFLNSAIENEEFDDNDKVLDDHVDILEQKMDLDPLGEVEVQSKDKNDYFSYSSGNEQLDIILADHLFYCSRLISVLLSNEANKCLEQDALKKMKNQMFCLSDLLRIIQKCPDYNIDEIFLDADSNVKELWKNIAGSSLYCLSDSMFQEIERFIKSKAVLDNYMASLVGQRLVSAILDYSPFEKPISAIRVSVLQFKLFFHNQNPETLICEFTADTLAGEDLKCRDVQKAFAAVSVLSKITPSSYTLFMIGCLLIEKNDDLKNIASCYLKTIGSNSEQRTKIITAFVEMLLSENAAVKLVACAALDALQAKNCSEQLMVVAVEDDDADVREAANVVLANFEKLSVADSPC